MKKRRLIPVLILKDGFLVQSREFQRFQNLGNPYTSVKRLSQWGSDELVYLDITRNDKYDLKRTDLNTKNLNNFLEIIEEVSKIVFMPIAVGGKIKSLNDINLRLSRGADKVIINSEFYRNKKFAQECSREFGSQCIVAAIDVKKNNNKYNFYIENGNVKINDPLQDWVKFLDESGVGEFFINSIDRDGTGEGYDYQLYDYIKKNTNKPIIFCGGAGKIDHIIDFAKERDADAVAAANIFQHFDQSIFITKKKLYKTGLNFRKPNLFNL